MKQTNRKVLTKKSQSERGERTNEIEKTMEIEKDKGKMNESSYNCFQIFAHLVGFSLPPAHSGILLL